AEDGIRYGHVTGVQTCALPISRRIFKGLLHFAHGSPAVTVRRSAHCETWISRSMETLLRWNPSSLAPVVMPLAPRSRSSANTCRSEERRVGNECRSWGARAHWM